MKTQAELKAHYRDVIIPMVAKYNYDHGTDVKPWECVKINGTVMIHQPDFKCDPNCYTFAITILEGKPVFVGDKLYSKSDGSEFIFGQNTDFYDATLTPPPKKRTFILNGVELPCPGETRKFVYEVNGDE